MGQWVEPCRALSICISVEQEGQGVVFLLDNTAKKVLIWEKSDQIRQEWSLEKEARQGGVEMPSSGRWQRLCRAYRDGRHRARVPPAPPTLHQPCVTADSVACKGSSLRPHLSRGTYAFQK